MEASQPIKDNPVTQMKTATLSITKEMKQEQPVLAVITLAPQNIAIFCAEITSGTMSEQLLKLTLMLREILVIQQLGGKSVDRKNSTINGNALNSKLNIILISLMSLHFLVWNTSGSICLYLKNSKNIAFPTA